ncbi:MAG: glycosyltransferase family 2 protein [Flavobacteriia bacterium]|nr:glycosyltransferase family 2 protein [Flavobacteriia bacterium]
MKDIAIVILNWNGKNYLEKFLPKVIAYANDCRIILADNASTDESISFVNQNFPSVEIVINSSNGGFAKGYNDALKIINAKYYLLLNSDIEVTENWIKPLYNSIQDPKIAGCQPKVLSYSNPDLFEHAGASGGFLDRNYFPFCRGRIFEKFEKDQGQYDSEIEIFWATGAALLIKAELFHLAGGFDEAFFAHMEEIDLCWRLKKQGYSFKVVPASKIYHVGGGTLPYLSPRKSYLNFRNSLFMIIKNHQGLLLPKLMYRMLLDGVAAIRFLIRGEFKHFASVFNAHVATYKRIQPLLKQRKEIKKTTQVFNATGLYNASILWARYFKKIEKFSELNKRFFK